MRVSRTLQPCPYWVPSHIPERFFEALVRLRARVIEQIGDDGAIREPCRGRVLESVLLFRLLGKTAAEPACRSRLAAFLEANRQSADPFDNMLARVALGERDTSNVEDLIHKLVRQAPAFASARKRAFVLTLFALLGLDVEMPDPADDGLDFAGLHDWAIVEVTAMRVILAAATGHKASVSDADRERLVATQGLSGIWEGHLLVHLFVLHALSEIPDTAELVLAGIQQALRYQRADGSIAFVCDTDTWCSVTGGIALLAVGAPRDVVCLVAQHVVRQQRTDGGWAFTDSAYQIDLDDTSVALQFLQVCDARHYRESTRRGVELLYAVRSADGGFPTYMRASPEACMTAASIDALTLDWSRHRDAIVTGLQFLADAQRPDETFPPDWSSSRLHTVFRALLAARRHAGYQPEHLGRMIARSMEFVLQTQNLDGGWGQQDGAASDPVSTAYAVIALCGQDNPTPVIRGLGYLLENQRVDGSIDSIADTVGPRPFVFDIPALANIFVLLAFGHVAHRLEPGSRTCWADSR